MVIQVHEVVFRVETLHLIILEVFLLLIPIHHSCLLVFEFVKSISNILTLSLQLPIGDSFRLVVDFGLMSGVEGVRVFGLLLVIELSFEFFVF